MRVDHDQTAHDILIGSERHSYSHTLATYHPTINDGGVNDDQLVLNPLRSVRSSLLVRLVYTMSPKQCLSA